MSQKSRHPSLERLLLAAEEFGIAGPSALAKALNESDQVVTNWGTRGVSKAGALGAQRRFGISSNWVLDGIEPRRVGSYSFASMAPMTGSAGEFPQPSIAQSVDVVSMALESIPDAARLEAAPLFQALTLAPDSQTLRKKLVALLSKT